MSATAAASAATASAAALATNIIFQGNSIDGWMAAYLTGLVYPADLVYFHPIDARTPDTWPAAEKLAPGIVLFVDCCPTGPDGKFAAEYAADLRRKHFPIRLFDNNPAAGKLISCDGFTVEHDASMSTTMLIWQHFCPSEPTPAWVSQVDRIENWHMMAANDMLIREVLLEICRLPVAGKIEEAMAATDNYLMAFEDDSRAAALLAAGLAKMDAKTTSYMPIVERTASIKLTAELCAKWQLPRMWIGSTILCVDTTTDPAPDSSELAACALRIKGGDAFINYRRRRGADGKWQYIYSARRAHDSGIDLVAPCSPFKGFSKSAGGCVVAHKGAVIPFISA